MTGFSWQQLGAFCVDLRNVSDRRLDQFHNVGGRWIVPVLVNDDSTGPSNRDLMSAFIARCRVRDIWVGMWANAFGDDPSALVHTMAPIVARYSLTPVVVDAEIAYQGNTKMSYLVEALRTQWPVGSKAIAISTNSMNDSQVYNGRKTTAQPTDKSFRDLNVHVLPQWYSAPRYWGKWTHADQNMEWVHLHGMEDNWLDPGYADKRAVAKMQIHGTLEVTGLEDASLATSLNECVVAQKQYGYTKGISIYTLENALDQDFNLLAAQRGVLYTN